MPVVISSAFVPHLKSTNSSILVLTSVSAAQVEAQVRLVLCNHQILSTFLLLHICVLNIFFFSHHFFLHLLFILHSFHLLFVFLLFFFVLFLFWFVLQLRPVDTAVLSSLLFSSSYHRSRRQGTCGSLSEQDIDSLSLPFPVSRSLSFTHSLTLSFIGWQNGILRQKTYSILGRIHAYSV